MTDHPQKKRRTAWEVAESLRSQSDRKPRRTPKYAPRFKEHFPALVAYVYRSRYVTADQVQARFPAIFTANDDGRRCRDHLMQLRDLGYLATADVKSTGVNFPLVHICTAKGTQLLRDHYGWELIEARDEARSLFSIEHELALTEFELMCWETVATREDLDILMTERRYYHKSKEFIYTQPGRGKRLIPDAGFLLRATAGDRRPLLLYLVEYDNGTESVSRVLQKFRNYHTWSQSGHRIGLGSRGEHLTTLLEEYHRYGSATDRPNYRLVVIAHRDTKTGTDADRLHDLFACALEVPDVMRNRLWFTTADDLMRAHHASTSSLTSTIWIRAADAEPWLADYRTFLTSHRQAGGRALTKAKREYLAHRLASLLRRAIFPTAVK